MYIKTGPELEQKFKMTQFPLNVAVEPSAYCNLDCIMCGHGELKRPKGVMDIRLYKKIVDEISQEDTGTRLWLDFYGEPLTAGFRLYYMIDYAKKKGIKNVLMNSNGILINNEYAEMLLDSGVDYISLDCDGFSKDVYESIRRGGNRDTFFSNIEHLLALKKKMNAKTIIEVKVIEMDENMHEVGRIMEYWRAQGAWTAVRRKGDWASFRLNEESENENRIACGHAISTCVITWDGQVAGCAWDGECEINCGDVNKDSIKEIWKNRNENIVRLHLEHRWTELSEICQKCTSWRNIGEMRFDEYGRPVERTYDTEKTFY